MYTRCGVCACVFVSGNCEKRQILKGDLLEKCFKWVIYAILMVQQTANLWLPTYLLIWTLETKDLLPQLSLQVFIISDS